MKKLNAVHVGISGFPFGRAAVYRCLAIYGLLKKENIDTLIINNWSTYKHDIPVEIRKRGVYDGIKYIYTTPSPYKPDNSLARKWYKIFGMINEYILLLQLSARGKIDLMFFYPTGNFFDLLIYRLFSVIFRYPLISHYVEFRSGFTKRKTNRWLRMNDYLFDNYFMKFVNGIIVISHFLIDQIKARYYKGPLIKIPPVSDYNSFHFIKFEKEVEYFLYAGGFYKETILLILEAYKMLNNNTYYLYLILNDYDQYKNIYLNMIKTHPKNDKIKIFSHLEYPELLNKYYNARALLIPLNDSVKDRARFPQKITEYLASGSPIITTPFGEIKYYFKDHSNAYIARDFTPSAFALKMNEIINDPDKAEKIGKNGYKTGLKYFSTKVYRKPLIKFIKTVMNGH